MVNVLLNHDFLCFHVWHTVQSMCCMSVDISQAIDDLQANLLASHRSSMI